MTEPSSTPAQSVAVVGAGLVGALCGSMLAARGFDVTIIESRSDPRKTAAAGRARSINLALSPRGIEALRSVSESLVDRVLEEGIEMRGRMLHKKGKGGRVEKEGQDYGYYDEGECIRSISRTTLGNFLLDHIDNITKQGSGTGGRVTVLFETKLVEMDLRNPSGTQLTIQSKGATTEQRQFDLVIGADGAYSKVRREMMRGANIR